jgi:hypothetical protein
MSEAGGRSSSKHILGLRMELSIVLVGKTWADNGSEALEAVLL